MLDTESKRRKEQQKQKVKKRYNVTIDPENYMFIPAKKQTDYYDNDVNQRVAIYVRVSTDDVRQTTSYELQKSIMKSSLLGIRTGRWLRSTLTKVSVVLPSKSGMSLIE